VPNFIASVMLVLWIPITLVLFARLPARTAASIAIVGAGVLLPQGISYDFSGVPALDRDAFGVLSALAGCVLFAPAFLRSRRPGAQLFEKVAVVMAVGAFVTAILNPDAIRVGPRTLQGLSVWDGISAFGGVLLLFGLPLYLGRALFRKPSDLVALFMVLAVGGMVYSIFVLWEVRMSPHLHQTLYGYQPGQWEMSKRGSLWGWRPMGFVGHGISLSMAMLSCTLAAAGIWRARGRLPWLSPPSATSFLYAVLFACQSFGTFMYATLALPAIVFSRLRLQAWLLSAIVILVMSYPLSRTFDIFPTTTLVEWARWFSVDRGASLEFRFINEDTLIEHAGKRVWFGWGSYGRNRPYDETTGRIAAITDGYWIIALGKGGAVGFVCAFGMLIGPVWVAARTLRRKRLSGEAVIVATTAWIVALNAVDLLPNGFLTARAIFIGGALMGALQGWRPSPAVLPGKPSRSRPDELRPVEIPQLGTDAAARRRHLASRAG
jgi:hypothetical protein